MPYQDSRLARLSERRAAAAAELGRLASQRSAVTEAADTAGRTDLTTDESQQFRDLTTQIQAQDELLAQLDDRIADLESEGRGGDPTDALDRIRRGTRASVTEQQTYEQGNGQSYLQDMVRQSLRMDTDGTAGERLQRHAVDVQEAVERRALSRTDGSGGYAVPPLWLMGQFVTMARAGRAYANVCNMQPLPAGTDSINIPKVLTGTRTSIQWDSENSITDNAAVDHLDLTDTSVNAPVRTIAGQQDVAIQLLDQSPVSFDEIVFSDLIADYATKVDQQVISGLGSAGQVTGVRHTTSIETVTYDADTPTVAQFYTAVADAVQRVHTLRFMPPTAIMMHPRRWAHLLAATDANGRPLVVPGPGNPQNAIATLGAVAAEQVVGQMHGLPVVTDPSMPSTLGTATDEDVVHVIRANDLILYESGVRSRVMPEVGSGTLTVRLQVYGYLAFTAARYPKSVVEIGGTGLAGTGLFG